MDTDTIPDVPSDNPETYCRLCFSGFYVEPVFPRDGPPRDALLDLIAQHVDIHLSPEADRTSMVCRMCQMTLESFHKYRTRCRTLDEVLQRRRQELAEFRVKVEKDADQPAPVRGFEKDTIYCLSDSDDEDGGGDDGGEQEGEELEPEDAMEEYEEVDENEEGEADEEDLIRGDMLVKPEPYGVDGRAAGYEEGGEVGGGEEEYQQPQMLPRKRERVDTDEVVLLDSDDDDGGGDGDDGEQSMAASTRASSEAPGQADDPEPDKALPYEVTEDGAYRCTICKESFRLMKEIKMHIRKAHKKDSLIYTCKHCPKKFWDLSILRVHNRYHTMDFPFTCDECGAKFHLKERMDVHVAKYHDKNSPQYSEKRFNCPLCPRIFMQEQGRQRHIRNFHEVRPDTLVMENSPLPNNFVYFCEPCEVSFETLEESKAHIAEKHPNEEGGDEGDESSAAKVAKRCKCTECGKLFRSRTAFRAHVLTNHGSNMPVVCDICGSGFLRKSQLNHHKERWHGENARNKGALERYKCDHCERFFMRNQDRIRHEQIIHHIEVPEKLPAVWEGRKGNFPCSKCDRKFPTMKTMRIHFSLKHPDVAVRFKCNVCAKLFKHKQTLRDHMLNHTGEQPFHCPDEQCNERFIRKKDYDRHMLDFHGPDDSGDEEKKKRFPCPHCPRKLLSRVARLMHIRHHHKDVSESVSATKQMLDNLPKDSNQCTYCPKIFNNRNTLKLHMMNHMGKLPHPCDQCDASYYKPTDLQKHKLRYHPGGSALSLANRFKCGYCPRVFVRKTARRYHQTVFHGVQAPPRKGAGAPTGKSRGNNRIKPDPDMVYPCALCSLTFKSSTMIQEHHQQHHPDQELFYKCPHCPHRTVNRQAFHSHVRLHSGGPRYSCDECTATFDRKLSLVTHKKRYHGSESKGGSPAVAKFKCSVCPREFMRNQDRVRHQVQMHDYRVKASADTAENAGPSATQGGRLKIKQERIDPKPAAKTTAPRDGFSVSSDVEEEAELITADNDDVSGQEEREEDVPSSVPTISCVVSIKEEAMATRRDTEF
uniref:Uncharacterized protein n=1 Tax=Culex tarsalis TaxID=7177 RepID=A0A1Q3F9Z7_CULTA